MLHGMEALLRELSVLDLLPPAAIEHFTATSPAGESARDGADRLLAAGALTAYQIEQLLAGKGRRLRLGPYVLRERLGRGGMGHVYKAEHRLMKRLVALKVAGRRDEAARTRFRREIEAAARLRHPRIVTAYDAGSQRGRLYLAMEYVDGIDLGSLVAGSGPLTIDLACTIVRQTAEALQHAHERGLVHRDVKPANVMLAPPGVTVKLLDFGLAHGTAAPAEEELCGTPDFMPPEYGHDPRRADVRGDLYSLGCTFYFLLTGQVPYPGGTGTEKLLRHGLDEPTPLCQLRPDVPSAVATVVERLMERDAQQRYASAAAVVAELTVLASAPSQTSKRANSSVRPLSAARLRAAAKSTRFSCAALVAILLGVAAAGGARWMTAPPVPSQPLVPAQPPVVDPKGPPFTLAGRGLGFDTLAKVIAMANDGDIIEIRGAGPFATPPLLWEGKTLTVRAVAGVRPRLTMKAGGDPWQALLQTDRSLTLEGLDLAVVADPAARSSIPAAPLIRCQQASLHLTNCRLIGGTNGPAVIVRRPREVLVRDCRINAGAVGLSVEVGPSPCRVRMQDCRLTMREKTAAALSLWAAEGRPAGTVELELQDNAIGAGRVAALRALSPQLTITAHNNHFTYREALLSYTAFAGRDAWRGTVWRGGGNRYEGPPSWLWVEGRAITPRGRPAPR